jgi:hypothetical protein
MARARAPEAPDRFGTGLDCPELGTSVLGGGWWAGIVMGMAYGIYISLLAQPASKSKHIMDPTEDVEVALMRVALGRLGLAAEPSQPTGLRACQKRPHRHSTACRQTVCES